MTKSNTFRLLKSLTVLGYVKHNEDRTYAATLKTWQVGRALLENMNLRELAAPEMRYLSEQTGETVYLGVPENLALVYIDKLDSDKPIRSWSPIGGSAPIHCVATGKAILAANYRDMRTKIAGRLTRHTDLSITTLEALDQDVAATLQQGYGFDRGEFRERILGFGAAVTLPSGEAIAAIGVSLPDVNMPPDGAERLSSLVVHAAAGITNRLARG